MEVLISENAQDAILLYATYDLESYYNLIRTSIQNLSSSDQMIKLGGISNIKSAELIILNNFEYYLTRGFWKKQKTSKFIFLLQKEILISLNPELRSEVFTDFSECYIESNGVKSAFKSILVHTVGYYELSDILFILRAYPIGKPGKTHLLHLPQFRNLAAIRLEIDSFDKVHKDCFITYKFS